MSYVISCEEITGCLTVQKISCYKCLLFKCIVSNIRDLDIFLIDRIIHTKNKENYLEYESVYEKWLLLCFLKSKHLILIINREEKFDTKDVNMYRNHGHMNIQQNMNFLQLRKLRFIYLQRKRKNIKTQKRKT